MRELCMIPCGSKKIWDIDPNAGPTPAREVYIGSFTRKCREYAEMFHPDSYCILSAKYGFVFPDEIIPEQYNVSFNKKSTRPISLEALRKQYSEKKLNQFDTIIVLGGKNYVKIVKKVFEGKEIKTPLKDCKGIGFMMKKLNDAILSGIPL
ncbi:MAG: DUF6884 domain-containing protein [Candidatus Helarchaeales archaeon]